MVRVGVVEAHVFNDEVEEAPRKRHRIDAIAKYRVDTLRAQLMILAFGKDEAVCQYSARSSTTSIRPRPMPSYAPLGTSMSWGRRRTRNPKQAVHGATGYAIIFSAKLACWHSIPQKH